MTQRVGALLSLLALAAAIQPAWTVISGNDAPLVFPKSARLGNGSTAGDTIGMSIDSNVTLFGDVIEQHDLSDDRVTVRLTELGPGGAELAVITPRAVVNAGPPDAAKFGRGTTPNPTPSPGGVLTIVLFDLPASLPVSLPLSVNVQLVVDGTPHPNIVGQLELIGTGGSPTVFSQSSNPLELQPRPMVRLRATEDPSGETGFSAGWTAIGGIEFTLVYPSAKLSAPEAFEASDASQATIILGPVLEEGSDRTVRIVMVDAEGIALNASDSFFGTHLGDGPIMDVVFTKLAPFDAADFEIRGLRVTDLDGVLLSPPMAPTADASSFFEIFPVKHQ